MKVLKWLLSAVIVIGVFFLIWKFGNFVLATFTNATDNVKAASIAAMVTVITFLLGRYFEQKRELRQRVNVEKIKIYQHFFDIYFGLFSGMKPGGKKINNDDLTQQLLKFQKQLILWGSDDVLKAYICFKDTLTEFGSSEAELPDKLALIMKSTSKLIVAMRKDIGYTFTSFSAKDLATLQLQGSDPEVLKVIEKL